MDRPLRLHPEASRYQQALLLALGGLALWALWACAWPWPVCGAASLLLLAGFAWQWRRTQTPPVQAVAWQPDQQRGWEILQDGAWAPACLTGPVVVTGLLTVLTLQPVSGGQLVTLALWPDSATPEALRQLRRILLAPVSPAPKEKGT